MRGGTIATAGWTQTTELPRRRRDRAPAATAACASFVYTDVDRDGMLEGPDLDDVARGRRAPCAGASSTRAGSARSSDLRALRALRQVNLAGVIVGKALYEGASRSPRRQAALDAQA